MAAGRGRAWVAGVGGAVLLAGLAGCSGSAQPSSPASGSASAAAASSAAAPGSAKDVDTKALAEKIVAAMRAKKSFSFTGTQTSAAGSTTLKGSMEMLDKGATMSVSMTGGGTGDVRMILTPDALYVASGEKIDGKTWLKMSLTGNQQMQATLGKLTGVADQMTKEFSAAKVTAVGQKTVNGVATTSYTWTMSETDLKDNLPEEMKTAAGGKLDGASGTSTMYVSADNLPVLVESTIKLAGQTATTSLTYSDWGGKVTITPPPAQDTASLPTS